MGFDDHIRKMAKEYGLKVHDTDMNWADDAKTKVSVTVRFSNDGGFTSEIIMDREHFERANADGALKLAEYFWEKSGIEGGRRDWQFSIDSWEMIERLLGIPSVRTLYLWGPPGIGKTYAAYHYGRTGKGFYAVTLTDETSAAELRGHFIFKGGDALWHDGPFIRAMREGKRLVINEITNASSDVLALLFPILESFETACITLPNGDTVRPAEGFHVIATDNRAPELLPEPLQDRFMGYVKVTRMHPKALDRIDDDLKRVAEQTIGEGDRLISARGWTALDILRKDLDLQDACKIAFGVSRGRNIHEALVLAFEMRAKEEQKKAALDAVESTDGE